MRGPRRRKSRVRSLAVLAAVLVLGTGALWLTSSGGGGKDTALNSAGIADEESEGADAPAEDGKAERGGEASDGAEAAAETAVPAGGPSKGADAAAKDDAGVTAGESADAQRDVQGLTKETIKVGFIVNRGGDDAFAADYQAAGQEPNFRYGDEKRQVEAIVADLNRRGGIGGRRVIAVISETGVFGQDYPRVCAHLIEDEKVFVAITSEVIGIRPELANCFAGRSTPLLTTPIITGDDRFIKDVSPWYLLPNGLADARMWRTLIPDLQDQGYFGPGAKIGLAYSWDVRMKRMAQEVVKPELEKIGVPVVAEYEHQTPGRTIGPAVVKFKAQGVTHVVLVPSFELGYFFWRDAPRQDYHPLYVIESGWATEALRVFYPQMKPSGSKGIGWRPQYDTPDSRYPRNETEERCFGLLRKAGVAVRTRHDPYPGPILCDNIWLFEAAAKKAGKSLTQAGFVESFNSLGTVPSAVTLKMDLSNKGPDGVDAYRRVVYDEACTCFVYEGPLRPVKR